MRQTLLAGLLIMAVILSACSNKSAAPATGHEVQETVLNFYNEMSKFDEMGKSSLENFNTTLTSYSTGNATEKELEKAVGEFQDTASDISDQVKEVEIASNLPDDIEKLLRDSTLAFQSAYSIKEQASRSAVSPDVTADEFNDMNQQADVAMLYGISKLNEAREAVGLLEADGSATEGAAEAGTVESPEAASDVQTEGGSVSGAESSTKQEQPQ